LKGKYVCGAVPLGYYIDDEMYFRVDTNLAPVVLEVFKRYSEVYRL